MLMAVPLRFREGKEPTRLKILLVNPNTTEGVTRRLMAAALPAASPGTQIDCVTAAMGVPYIATRTEAAIGAMAVLEMLSERYEEYDGAIVAAFGDPGLGAARELFDLPVVGLAEAGMLTACMLGGRFAIVSFATALGPWYEECVRWHRLGSRCAGIRMLDGSFQSIESVQEEKTELLVELALRAVNEDGADVVILAGAPLAGLASVVRDRLPVPVVDSIQAAVRQVETLVSLNVRPPTAGTYRRPAAKPARGLSERLARRISRDVDFS